ncbi:MAG: putative DNA-binding domain-containing protein, partial [Bradyrhizobium sp.]|nr:putative DNA-binding domain-containing protein [Bradyrhizobium sp.]
AALLDPARPAPPGLVGPDGEDSARRFAIYRNNVSVALIGALEANFPATCRIVGEEFFRAMARTHALLEPPASPILLDYGAGFPDFIARFTLADSVPYLADVARIERAWTEAYHAPEDSPLDPAMLSCIPGDEAAELCFTLHPSVRIVRSQFPALTIWRMNVADGVPAPVDLDSSGENALVTRPDAEVEVRSIPAGGADFIEALAQGHRLVEAAKAGLRAAAEFDLTGNLTALLGAGVFVGSRPATSTNHRLGPHAR